MSNLDSTEPFGKKALGGLATIPDIEKTERIARKSLRDLMLFNNTLEAEMKRMMVAVQHGAELDNELFDKMTLVKDKYNYAMSGLQALAAEEERGAFMALADSIQDLMFYLHNRREH